MKGKELKNTGKIIELLDGNHKLTIDYNAFESLEELYGTVQKAFDKFEGNVKFVDIKKFVCAAVNACIEDEEERYTPFTIGKLLDMRKRQDYVNLISKLLLQAMPAPKDDSDDDTESETGEDEKN